MRHIRRLLGVPYVPFLKQPRPRLDTKRYALLLPTHEKSPRFRFSVRRPSYRRIGSWVAAAIIVICLIVYTIVEAVEANKPHWSRYPKLKGYFHGIESIVPFSDYIPEYPNCAHRMSARPQSKKPSFTNPPLPMRFRSLFYQSEEDGGPEQCYLDSQEKIPAPDLYAYSGIPQFQPLPVIGSHDVINLSDNVCFDRYGRYGPYGLGYSADEGGTDKGIPKRSDTAIDHIWNQAGRVDYRNIDWGDAQRRCYRANRRHFTAAAATDADKGGRTPKRHRQAVVVRTYTGYKWTQYAILNIRAMVNEASLISGGQYGVHLLLHVRNTNIASWDDAAKRQKILESNVPKEFHSLCTLWSEAQMKEYYPGDFGDTVEDISHQDIHGVYRSGHMSLQHFALCHPEYAHFWNWEMDVRFIGSYYELFSGIGRWAQEQSRAMMWERSATYYIPAFHGSWEDFSEGMKWNMFMAERHPILGPLESSTKQEAGPIEDYLPESCERGRDVWKCGVGEPADLITLNPIFDVEDSGWVFHKDITGYNFTNDTPLPPRRSTIVTASRLSRRLLNIMHQETIKLHHSMFTEMFPPSIALHHGLKAVYAPHPIYLDRTWPEAKVNRVFNGGKDNSTSGPGSPFDWDNEHNHKGLTWYYHAEFAGTLWRHWLGVSKNEKKGNNEGASRLCLRSMLVHPVKWEEKSKH